MSRSLKKSICSVGESRNQKKWKNQCNRKIRRASCEEIPDGSNYRKSFGDIWDSPSDGKRIFKPLGKIYK